MNNDPFKKYIRGSEPDKQDRGYVRHTVIGLQAVDGLKTAEYLVHIAVCSIITVPEVKFWGGEVK